MNDVHVTAVATVVEVALLAVNAVLFGYYLHETHKTRKAAERQVEASFRPAVIVQNLVSTSEHPKLKNIGNGPAMSVRWVLRDSKLADNFSFLLAGESQYMQCEPKHIFEASGAGRAPQALCAEIECTYSSLSGRRYSSVSTVNLETFRVTTAFSEP